MKYIYKIIWVFYLFSVMAQGNTVSKIKQFVPTEKEQKDGAVIIEKWKDIKIDKNAHKKTTSYFLIAILNDEAARDYVQMEFMYNAYYVDRKLDFARIIDADGTVRDVDKDAIQIRNPQNYNSYDDTKVIVFSLPAIKAGSFIEVQLSAESKRNIIENETSSIGGFMMWQTNQSTRRVRLDSVRESQFSIEIAKERALYYHVDDKAILSIEEKNETICYRWKMQQMPKQKIEQATLYSYSNFVPLISYSTIKEWKTLASYFFRYYDEASHPNSAIKVLATEITAGSHTVEEKTKKLFAYVQENIRYVFAHLGRGGMLPHPASNVLENRYGDCKDQTVFFLSLLKSLGIEAYPALIHAYQDGFKKEEAVSTYYFNHVITYIPDLDRFIDTTGFNSVYPGTAWTLAEKNTLILHPSQEMIKKLPEAEKENFEIDITFEVNGSKLQGRVHYKPSKQFSNSYKSMIANTQNASLLLEKDLSSLYQNAETQTFNILNADNANMPLEMMWTFYVPLEEANLSKYAFAGIMNTMLSKILPLSIMERPQNRVHGFKMGYPIKIDIHTVYKFPDNGFRLYAQMLPKAFSNAYYTYKNSYQEKTNITEIMETLEVIQYKIPQKKYADFYQKTGETIQKTSMLALFEKDQFKIKELTLKEQALKEKNATQMIALTEHYLDAMEYEEGKKVIEKVIAMEPNNAKAHYVYGIVLGYMDEFDKSDVELLKARKMGYRE